MNIDWTAAGTSRIVVPVTSSRPNSTPMINSGVAIQGVSPSDSGPPITKPTNPATRCRSAGSVGAPDHRCHRPSTGSAIIVVPRTSRGRDSGFGSVRISRTASATRRMGSNTTAEPMTVRTTESIQPPTGRAASNHELAASTTERPSSASAMPSRRWPGSISRARPTDRAVEPAPLANISQLARAPLPMAEPAVATGEGLRRGAGLRRGGSGARRARSGL